MTMKALLILALTPFLVAQTPAPKTAADADQQAINLMVQRQQAEIQLRQDPNFLLWEKLESDITNAKNKAKAMHDAESQAAQDKVRKEKFAKAQADAAAKAKKP
jgi:hypothetical protein